jgi:CBS domain-containing protein
VVAQQTVRDVMNSNPVTVTTRTSFKDLVGLMIGKDLSAVLVLGRHGEIVGLVTETDLLRKQGLQRGPEIRNDVTRELRAGSFTASPDEVMADVAGGVVTVAGEVRCKSMLPLVLAAIRAVAGVVDVEGQLGLSAVDERCPAGGCDSGQGPRGQTCRLSPLVRHPRA